MRYYKVSLSKYFLLLLFYFFNEKIFALNNNEFIERRIRGTEIIHVMLESNSDANSVLDYIKENINSEFNGYISSTPSYNNYKNDSIHWHIKDIEDDILAVYFDGGSREGRDKNYDFIDLRWLGNGSPKMYCFWKIDGLNILNHNNIIKTQHAKNSGVFLIWFIQKHLI